MIQYEWEFLVTTNKIMLVTDIYGTFGVPDSVYTRQLVYDSQVLKQVQNSVQNINRSEVMVPTNGGVYHKAQAPYYKGIARRGGTVP